VTRDGLFFHHFPLSSRPPAFLSFFCCALIAEYDHLTTPDVESSFRRNQLHYDRSASKLSELSQQWRRTGPSTIVDLQEHLLT
jgi:hypothetical protein